MTTTPNRWIVRCDGVGITCQTRPAEVEAVSLAALRAQLRLQGWHLGAWPEWSGRANLDLCPTCVARAQRLIAEHALLRTGAGTIE